MLLSLALSCQGREPFDIWCTSSWGLDWTVTNPTTLKVKWGFPGDSKEAACNAGDLGSMPGSGRSPGEGHGNQLQFSCLENFMERGTWWTTVHEVAKRYDWVTNTFTPFSLSVLHGLLAAEPWVCHLVPLSFSFSLDIAPQTIVAEFTLQTGPYERNNEPFHLKRIIWRSRDFLKRQY